MASISTNAAGLRRILFFDAAGKRRVVRMGRTAMKTVESVKGRIEDIVAAQAMRTSVDLETAMWLGEIDDKLHGRLVAKGLASPRAGTGVTMLGAFIDGYIATRTDVKPNTKAHLERARKNLVDFFGRDTPLVDITQGDADEFRLDLKQTMGDNTVRRICGRAKQFFRVAVRKRLIAESPFGDMKDTAVRANKLREFFVSRETAQKVIDACPDAQWRLIFALARYGGLRCPSEHVALRWGDVDWERGRMRVTSPKTEHHEGKGFRWIPIFPELLPHLEAAFEEAAEGTEVVITRYRDRNTNMRTTLERIIAKAGVDQWPKLFQNLRSTRQTELAELYPSHVVCAWLGNSEAIAAKHYLQVTDAHFEAASEKAAQKPAQQAPASVGKGGQAKQATSEDAGECRHVLTLAQESIPPRGVEPRFSG